MNVGRHFPITQKCYVGFYDPAVSGHGKTFPRRIRLAPKSFTAVGTVAVKWQGIEVASEVAEFAPGDETALVYRINHPTDSSTHGELWVKPNQITTGMAPGNFGLLYSMEFFDGVDVVARLEGRFAITYVFGIWPQPPYNWQWGPAWTFKPVPAKWTSMNCFMGAGIWDDSPEFKPYVTRP